MHSSLRLLFFKRSASSLLAPLGFLTRHMSDVFSKFFSRIVTGFILISLVGQIAVGQSTRRHKTVYPGKQFVLSRKDNVFLEDLSHRSFQYFWEQANPKTGLVMDRARTDGSAIDERHRDISSIAATGFGLTALCIAAERHWIQPEQARERTRATLSFFADHAFQEHGWFY